MRMRLAILTGDLIGSQDLAPGDIDAGFAALRDAAADIARWEGCAGTVFGRFRGDGWQVALPCPARALRAALVLRAALRGAADGLETRIAIAEGDGPLPDGDINAQTGPAYVASGRGLDRIGGGPATMLFADGGPVGAATRLADHVSAGWTRAQARAIRHALPPGRRTQAAIAAALGITRQAARQALIGAGFPALDDALALIEQAADG